MGRRTLVTHNDGTCKFMEPYFSIIFIISMNNTIFFTRGHASLWSRERYIFGGMVMPAAI